MTDGEHHIHRSVDAYGWCASCTCGWRTVRHTRQLRDQDVDAHQLDNHHGGDAA
jgi:hypothetical protein